MGSRLEKVRQNVENASRIEQKGVEQGERDASEVREIKSIIEGMDRDVDDDIVEAMEATREAAKSEGADHMRTETHRTLESGYQVAQDAIQEGNDQAGTFDSFIAVAKNYFMADISFNCPLTSQLLLSAKRKVHLLNSTSFQFEDLYLRF